MQQKQEQRPVLNKSEIQLDDQDDNIQKLQKQPDLPVNRETKLQQPQSLHNNLIDMAEPQLEQKAKYLKFLQGRVVYIDKPQLITESLIKSYKLYKVRTRKSEDPKQDTCVSRRFSDFEYLQRQLVELHGGCIIPLLPEKNFWANLNLQGEQEITNRVQALQDYLQDLLTHSMLSQSSELRVFLFEDEAKFSQQKGEFFSGVKTEQKIKEIASSALSAGKTLINKFVYKNHTEQPRIAIAKPNEDDIVLIEYQREVTDLVKVLGTLRHVVQNSVIEITSIAMLLPQSKEAGFKYSELLTQFEKVCKFIYSCDQALKRRTRVRLQLDKLNSEYEAAQGKIRSNPRSQDIDILRNRIVKNSERCEKWTQCLKLELQRSIHQGRSMLEDFIGSYSRARQAFYSL